MLGYAQFEILAVASVVRAVIASQYVGVEGHSLGSTVGARPSTSSGRTVVGDWSPGPIGGRLSPVILGLGIEGKNRSAP